MKTLQLMSKLTRQQIGEERRNKKHEPQPDHWYRPKKETK